jgi:hypothetical protein
MVQNKLTLGILIGIISTVLFFIFVASNTIQSNSVLERRVSSLESRVSKLERQSSTTTNRSSTSSNSNWRRLQNNMTMDQVRRIMGEPDRVSNMGSGIMTWKYGTGDVWFTNNKVSRWSEPYN